MEILEVVVETALIAMVRLGLPVVVLFLVGYWMHRASQQPRACAGHDSAPPSDADEHPVAACWRRKPCPPEVRASCAAYRHPDLPCWRAVKTARGRIKAACPGCELFLTMPARSNQRR